MEIVVPIDITAEEKEILAIFSKRQFMLVFPTGVLSLIFLLYGNIPFLPTVPDMILRGLISFLALGIALLLAYFKVDKYEQYASEYVVTQLKFWRSQKTYY
ncbi:PrgI family protein [Aneurinibacillus tyrosinisolvens]|uniref:PrgI family protein n=1 Tax=Aneurinibacillus tyrosinisolvens TaxID=1443435 RepID=UPI00063F8EFB|nr:PrgI family protein [Aneurinibacillus tyrosinisolvens]